MKPMRYVLALSLATMMAPVPMFAAEQAPATPETAAGACPNARASAHRQRMQAMHEALAKATTSAEREKILADQMKLMHQGMDMMHGMSGMPMGGPMGMRGQRGGGPDACMAERMAMMEMMMQTMMDRMAAEHPAK